MRRALFLVASVVLGLTLGSVVWAWLGPLISGAYWVTRGSSSKPMRHDLPTSYRPLHKGRVDISTGLYVREDEDVIMRRTPPFRLTRTYLSGDHVSRQFGVGTTNNAEWYLIPGDAARFQWADLILADGGRIRFDRTSRETSYEGAPFLHTTTPTAFYGAQLGWTGRNWVMRFSDGGLATFQGCSAIGNSVCSLIELRDDDGHTLRFRRDRTGRLTAIESPSERATFEYDSDNRIIAVNGDDSARVDYSYDSRGRLIRVHSAAGVTREYTYGPRNEMLTIREPGWFIENTYDNDLRVIRQSTLLDASEGRNAPEEWLISMAYTIVDNAVIQTDVTEYDRTHTVHRFNSRHYPEFEIRDATGANPVLLSIDRDPSGQFVSGLTVRCTVNGRRVTRSESKIDGVSEEQIKETLIAEACLTPRLQERR